MKQLLLTILIILMIGGVLPAQRKADFTLHECIIYAIDHNPTLRNARYEVEMAGYNKITGISGWLPVISGSGYMSKSESGPTSYLAGEYVGEGFPGLNEVRKTNNYGYNFSVRMNVLDAGVTYFNFKKSGTDFRNKVAGYENQLQQTVLLIVEKYYDLVKQAKILEVKKKAVARSEEQLRRAETMFKLGAAAKVDMYRAKVNLGNDKMAFLQQKNALDNARHQLNLAMGRDPMADISVTEELQPELSMEELSMLQEELNRSNPALLNLQYALSSSRYSRKVAFGSSLPTLSFFVNWSRNIPEVDALFKDFDREYNFSYGLSLNFNIFNGFRDFVNYQNAKIAEKMSFENLNLQKQQLLSQLKYYYNQFNTYKEIRETNLLNIDAAREEYRLADERFKVGAGTSLELREAQVNLSQAEQLLIESDYQLVLTRKQILALIGKLKQ